MNIPKTHKPPISNELCLSTLANWRLSLKRKIGEGFLFAVAAISFLAVLFIFYFIFKDAFPFFKEAGIKEFFMNKNWYPAAEPPIFGALSVLYGTLLVTLGAAIIAIPLGVVSAIGLSDILSFRVRQIMKPVIEILAAIPSVAYGFFALVILAPFLQNQGNLFLQVVLWCGGTPILFFSAWLIAIRSGTKMTGTQQRKVSGKQIVIFLVLACLSLGLLYFLNEKLGNIVISSGTNALNVSLILGIMALPTIISLSEDALQAVPKEIREGSYALGATKAETLFKVVVPAASSGIISAIILGMMRVVGETMVVWMASGNSAQIPEPFYNLLEPIRTLTATIAGEMGEADQTTGSARYHVLFVMAFILLFISMILNMLSNLYADRKKRRNK